MSFWPTVLERIEADERVFVALVADHSIHSPGTTGARLAVFESGKTMGTIGGGIMEHELVERARAIFSDPSDGYIEPELHKLYHRKHGEGEKSGLICAGFQTNLYLTVEPDRDRAALRRAVEAEKDQRGILEITPSGVHFLQDSESDDVDQNGDVRQTAVRTRHLAHDEQSRLEEPEEEGGDWRYLERLVNLRRAAIMGGGHCGLALSRTLHGLGYFVSIFDTRPRVPTILENDFTDRKEIVDDFADAAAMVDFPNLTHVVVMTTALPSDVRALLGVLAGPFPFVGVMGSLAKIAQIKKDLRAHGVDETALSRIVAPVGLPMRSNTPEEIAVSVAAQLLQQDAETRSV